MADMLAPVLRLVSQSPDAITLAWTDPNTSEKGSDIQRKRDNNNWINMFAPAKDVVTWTDTELPTATPAEIHLTYRIRVRGPGGVVSPWSNLIEAMIPSSTALSVPELTATLQPTPLQGTVTWTDPNAGSATSQLQRAVSGTNYVIIGSFPAGVLSWTDTGLPSGPEPVTVNYQVRAERAGTASAWSDVASLEVPAVAPEPPPDGETIPAASLAFMSVKAAVDACPPGGTVLLPAGSETWDLGEAPLVIDKPLILKGAGQDATIITDMGIDNIIKIVTVAGNATRICHLTLVGGTVDYLDATTKRINGVNCIMALGQGKVRIDHVTFDCTHVAPARPAGQGSVVQVRAVLAREGVTGVVDHCLHKNGGGLRAAVHTQHNNWQGVGDFGDNSWATPTGWGNPDSAMYFEDNVFEAVGTSGWAHDSHQGGRSVLRYNTLKNVNLAAHGSEAGARGRGTRLLEIYRNTAPDRTSGSSVFCDVRSGPIAIWGNTIGKGYTGLCRLDNNRSTQNFGTWLSADGAFAFDLNEGIVHESGTAGAGSGPNLLVDPTKNWAPDQWVGGRYSLRNTTAGRAEGSFIIDNDGTSIKTQPGTSGSGPVFQPGDTYQILRCQRAMDQCGLGEGKLLKNATPVLADTGAPGWVAQAADPCYAWDNTIAGTSNNNMSTPGVHIRRDIDFFNGMEKPNYTPAVHPHPLVTSGFTAGE